MNIQVFPDEVSAIINEGNVQMHDYQTSQSLDKNKVQLSKHVCSFLLEGSKRVITPDKEITIENDQFLMIKAGKCLMSEKISLGKTYRSLLLFFDQAAVQQLIQKYTLTVGQQQLQEPFFIGTYDGFIQHWLEGVLGIQQMPFEFQQKLLPLKLEEIMLYLAQKYGASFLYQFLENQHTDISFVQTVQKNALSLLSISEMAFLCNMSISTFKRRFEQEFHTSPMRWFAEKRLEHAWYLLNHEKMRPSEVYQQVGFESLSSFIQAFKQKFGTTPKQLQKTNLDF